MRDPKYRNEQLLERQKRSKQAMEKLVKYETQFWEILDNDVSQTMETSQNTTSLVNFATTSTQIYGCNDGIVLFRYKSQARTEFLTYDDLLNKLDILISNF